MLPMRQVHLPWYTQVYHCCIFHHLALASRRWFDGSHFQRIILWLSASPFSPDKDHFLSILLAVEIASLVHLLSGNPALPSKIGKIVRVNLSVIVLFQYRQHFRSTNPINLRQSLTSFLCTSNSILCTSQFCKM